MAELAAAAAGVSAGAASVQAFEAGLKVWDRVKDRAPKRVIKRDGAPDIKNFGTLRKPLQDIVIWLANSSNFKENGKPGTPGIGIHGTPGIGKTTIMENLNNHVEVAKMFHIVIWLQVSKLDLKENLRREDLQQDIVQRLKLKKEGTTNPDDVAQRITEELKGKKYLLLLDDVKEPLELSKIGIPDSNNGSKIVLTTRKRPICRLMDLEKEIKVEYLSINEAWEMFQDVIGNKGLNKNGNIWQTAYKVCQECCGLPLLITKVAPTFKFNTTPKVWEEVLDDWRKWPVRDLDGTRELYRIMRYCYDDLKDEMSQKCFLYGALYPEDSAINKDSLLECWEAEKFLVHGEDKRTERVKDGSSTLDDLQYVSLLEEGKRDYLVTMDKFIRQVALYISEDHGEFKHLVKTNKNLSIPPGEEFWSEKNRISLGANYLDQLPRSPKCIKLSTLFLQANKFLKEIPSDFFNGMENLRVLDLSDTGIKSLPSSLEILKKLKVLHLNDCKQLVELPSNIDGLVDLEFLDIHGSGIKGIPLDIKKLKLLKHLWVSFGNGNHAQGVGFEYNVISELSELEDLVIDFESRQQCTNEVVENIMKQVAKLKKFKKLRVCFPEMSVDVIEVTPKTVNIKVPELIALLSYIEESLWEEVGKTTEFEFFISPWEEVGKRLENGGYGRHPKLIRYAKYAKFCNGVGSNTPILDPIVKVLKEAEGLELVDDGDIKQLSDFGTANMNKIQGFLIERCVAIETIMDTVGSELLPNLEQLIIKNLPKLKSIWKEGTIQPRCQASKLTTLVIYECQDLDNVFPPGAIHHLCEIQYLTIAKCYKVKEIILKDDARGNLPILPKLKELILLDMKKLSRICAIESLKLSSLEKLKIFECSRLRKLPFNRGDVPNLNCIEAEKEWWGALKLPKQKDKKVLQTATLCTFRSRNDKDAAV